MSWLPPPVSETVCGFPEALSETTRFAVRFPTNEGMKTTTMLQGPPAATEVPQLLFSMKSPELAQETAMLDIPRAKVPALVRVTFRAKLEIVTGRFGNARLVGDRTAAGLGDHTVGAPEADPSPEIVTVCGLSEALSVICNEALRVPTVVGLKEARTVHAPDGLMEPVQLLVCLKSEKLAPAKVTAVIFKVASPVFVTERASGPAIVPTA